MDTKVFESEHVAAMRRESDDAFAKHAEENPKLRLIALGLHAQYCALTGFLARLMSHYERRSRSDIANRN